MKQYEFYKPSGTPWIGDMPSHWEKKKLRFVCEFRNGYTPSKANQDFWSDGTIPWYRMEDIRDSGRFLNEAKQYVTEEAVKGQGLFEAGSFILATTATIGEHAMLIVDSLANQRFTNLKIRKSLGHSCLKEFFFYYLFLIDEFCKSSTRTATFPAMDMEDLRNFDVAIPPLAEQEAIATYLDRKCESIDKAIATQERRITLLTELKQSIITEAVTHGLNPDAPLKDSGIDWIGQIPEHWEVMKIKFVGDVKGRIGFKGYSAGDLVSEGEGAYTIGGKHISNNVLDLSNPDFISWDKYYESPEIMVKKGDIVIAQRGTLKRAAYIADDISEATINPSLVLLTNITINAKYLHLYICSSATTEYIDFLNTATAVPMISQNQIENIPILVPPKNEQAQIVSYLNKKYARIDSAIAKAKCEIELLREFKQSVITEAVTGKIKVC